MNKITDHYSGPSARDEMERLRRECDDARVKEIIGEIFMAEHGASVEEICAGHERLVALYSVEIIDPLRKVWIARDIVPVEPGAQQGNVSNGAHDGIVLEFPIDVGESSQVLAPFQLSFLGEGEDGPNKVAEYFTKVAKLKACLETAEKFVQTAPMYYRDGGAIDGALLYLGIFNLSRRVETDRAKKALTEHEGRLTAYTKVDAVELRFASSEPLRLALYPDAFAEVFVPHITQEITVEMMGILSSYERQELLHGSHNRAYIVAVMREYAERIIASHRDDIAMTQYLLERIKASDFFKRNTWSRVPIQDAPVGQRGDTGPQDATFTSPRDADTGEGPATASTFRVVDKTSEHFPPN